MPRKSKEVDIDEELSDLPEGSGVIDPILKGMLMRLPAPGGVWPIAARKAWLELWEKACGIIYPDTDQRNPSAKPGE